MKNYIQPGKAITLLALALVASGSGVLIGALFGIATGNAAIGEAFTMERTGVFDVVKATGNAWTEGQKVYWDNTAQAFTGTASGNKLVGAAVIAAQTDATVGTVLLDGVIR